MNNCDLEKYKFWRAVQRHGMKDKYRYLLFSVHTPWQEYVFVLQWSWTWHKQWERTGIQIPWYLRGTPDIPPLGPCCWADASKAFTPFCVASSCQSIPRFSITLRNSLFLSFLLVFRSSFSDFAHSKYQGQFLLQINLLFTYLEIILNELMR